MMIFSSLSPKQRESIGLLQAGTFLEYFDLFLYVHMTVLLNELFFPATDPHTKTLLAAFALCSSIAFRPIGALIFGWIGDHWGRKQTIVISTTMMSLSCIIMANLPTYDQIGIAAAWIMIICRLLQGTSSMGEIVGASIYITEITERPQRFPLVAFLDIIGNLGQTMALAVVYIVVVFGMNWRLAFWVGAIIAITGAFARARLLETPEFLKMKRNKTFNDAMESSKEKSPFDNKFSDKKTILYYFFINCGTPLWFYLGFFHFIPTLINQYEYEPKDVIVYNFSLSIVSLIASGVWTYMSSRIHPLRILKVRTILSLGYIIMLPFLIMKVTSPSQLFWIQSLLLILSLEEVPSAAVFLSYIPVRKRFTYVSLLYSFARALTYISTSFGMIYFSKHLGNYGVWVISLPIAVSFLYGILYFEGLERKNHLYPNLS